MSAEDQDTETLIKQGQEAAANMAEAMALSHEIWTGILDTQSKSQKPTHDDPDPMNAGEVLGDLTRSMLDNPREVADATIRYWTEAAELWQQAVQKNLSDAPKEADDTPLPRAEKRFAHPEWSTNPFYDFVKKSYLLGVDTANDLVAQLDDLDPRQRRKAAFFTRNFLEALNPANFFALNPEVLSATAEEKGANLVRGLKMMRADLERGKGKLMIRQTDMDAFEVGRDLATTPGAVIWENNILQLIQYAPTTEKVHATPLLIIPPWINKYYILDLNEKKSMVRWLVSQGHSVFVISWVNPDTRQKDETWESYMFDGALAAIDKVLAESDAKSLNLASYCIGGTLVGTLLAHLSAKGDKRIKRATFFTTQLDFEDAGDLQVFVDDKGIDAVDAEMTEGYLPAEKMAMAFNMLRASDLIWSYVVSNYMLGRAPVPFDMLFWNADSTAMPAKVHHFYLQEFYDRNNLIHDRLKIKGKIARLSDTKVPIYHLAAREDHIAPAPSVYRGARQMGTGKQRFVLAGSGHIAGVVNPPAAKKYQFWSNDDLSAETLEGWLDGATETPGSWWTDWDRWLVEGAAKKVAARQPGAVSGVVEPAPGRYVKRRFDKD